MDTNPKRLRHTQKHHHGMTQMKKKNTQKKPPKKKRLSLDLHLNQEQTKIENIKRSDNGVKE